MDAQNFAAQLSDSIARVGLKVLEYLPNILGALALVLIGWLVARLLRAAVSRIAKGILRTVGRQRVGSTKAVDAHTQRSRTWQTTPAIVAGVVYWTVLLFFIAAAIEALGLRAVSNFVGLVTAYLPRVLAGVLILLVGIWAGEFLRLLITRATARAKLAWGDLMARVAQVMVVPTLCGPANTKEGSSRSPTPQSCSRANRAGSWCLRSASTRNPPSSSSAEIQHERNAVGL
jgi:hypothetical protein